MSFVDKRATICARRHYQKQDLQNVRQSENFLYPCNFRLGRTSQKYYALINRAGGPYEEMFVLTFKAYGPNNFQCQNNKYLKMDDFLEKLKKVVRIVFHHRLAISPSDCRKAVPYQFPYNNISLITDWTVYTEKYKA